VGDVVTAVLAAGTADGIGGEAYNIGGGSRVSLAATLELLAAIAGRPLDVRHQERESGDVQDTGAAIDRARGSRLRARHRAARRPAGRIRVGARAFART
jgi:UDP-glucuronate 4-epimerase